MSEPFSVLRLLVRWIGELMIIREPLVLTKVTACVAITLR